MRNYDKEVGTAKRIWFVRNCGHWACFEKPLHVGNTLNDYKVSVKPLSFKNLSLVYVFLVLFSVL
jgi:hypothetical protein